MKEAAAATAGSLDFSEGLRDFDEADRSGLTEHSMCLFFDWRFEWTESLSFC